MQHVQVPRCSQLQLVQHVHGDGISMAESQACGFFPSLTPLRRLSKIFYKSSQLPINESAGEGEVRGSRGGGGCRQRRELPSQWIRRTTSTAAMKRVTTRSQSAASPPRTSPRACRPTNPSSRCARVCLRACVRACGGAFVRACHVCVKGEGSVVVGHDIISHLRFTPGSMSQREQCT